MAKNLKILKDNIKGPIFSIVTPFKEDSSIDYKSLLNYLKKEFTSLVEESFM